MFLFIIHFSSSQALIDMNYRKIHEKGKPSKGSTHDRINFKFQRGENISEGNPSVNQEGSNHTDFYDYLQLLRSKLKTPLSGKQTYSFCFRAKVIGKLLQSCI